MRQIRVFREQGLYRDEDKGTRLLVQRADLEIIRQKLNNTSVAWIVPAEDRTMTEFYHVLSGEITLFTDPPTVLRAGDSFTTELLEGEVRMASAGDSELLWVTNRPAFENVSQFSQQLLELVARVDEKDRYTREHCLHVMRLSVKLYQLLDEQEGLTLDELVPAAVFHDVGKCEIPDEILKKPGRYTPEEYAHMKRHPVESERILQAHYSADVARIARLHHERMDGSGYPDGLRGLDIPLGARILAVADSFDAMTAGRTYAPVRTYAEALAELRAHPAAYDARVVDALDTLLHAGHPLFEALL